MSYIVNAGVVARWFTRGEEWEDRALRLRNDSVHGKIRLYSPTLLKFECLNVVWKAYKLGLLSLEVLIKMAKLMWRLTPELVQPAQGLAEDFKPLQLSWV
ncbi:TPA: hypothetical protein EYP27_02830 [Candidatus Bathyarchaeota archaeon]|nr:hypothetical protein [Candidatus Bathyarchaeota archaeon]